MKFIERLGKTKVERATTSLVLSASTLAVAVLTFHRGFGIISSETMSCLMLVVTALQFAAFVPLYVHWKQTKTHKKLRLKKETDAAAQAEIYLSGEMTTWK